MLLRKDSELSWKEKTRQHWISNFQISHKHQTSFMTDPLNIIFDNFGIGLLGYRTKFSRL